MESKTKLYVGNLPYSLTSDQLREMFAKYGEVVDAVVIMDKRTGRSKGFGFVEFADAKVATDAQAKTNGSEVEGRKLIVNFARPPKENTN